MAWPETVRKSDLNITWFSGKGGGGQHRNKHANCCRMEHIPTGITVTGQSHKERPANQKEAFKALTDLLVPIMLMSARRPQSDDQNRETIRTYNYKRGTAKDHRTGEEVSLTDILEGKRLTGHGG